MSQQTTWIIGGESDCDIVIDRPSVSRRHCRLTRSADGTYTLEDLGSTNGTYVNGQRIHFETIVSRRDAITLGASVAMPWPNEPAATGLDSVTALPAPRMLRIGRDRDNDFVIDRPDVSSHHARVTIAPGSREGRLEDLGSTNGTAVGAQENRATHATITPDDVIYFGPVAVLAAAFFPVSPTAFPTLLFAGETLTVGRDPECDRMLDVPVVSGRHAQFSRSDGAVLVDDLGSSNGTFVNGRKIDRQTAVIPGDLVGFGSFLIRFADASPIAGPVATMSQSSWLPATKWPLWITLAATTVVMAVAFGALLLLGSRPTALFGAALLAVWCGMMAPTVARIHDPAFRMAGDRKTMYVVLWNLMNLWALGASFWVLGPDPEKRGDLFGGMLVFFLTVLIGMAMGEAVLRLAGRLEAGVAVAVVLLVLMSVVASPLCPLPSLPGAVRWMAGALPTRWSFEALLQLSTDGEDDVIERYFPRESDRSGLLSCATALLAMLAGLIYANLVISLRPPPPADPATH